MDFKIPLPPARRLGGALVALGFLFTLAAPANAAPCGEAPFFASAWRLLWALFEGEGFVVDPSGQPAEAGFNVDPSGRNQPRALFGEAGFVVDPNGLAHALPPPVNAGFDADPNG